MTRELLLHGFGETVLSKMLAENAAAALDTSLFSTTAASAIRPPGILAGVAALTPTVAGVDAMNSDLATLAGAISTVSSDLAYIANPKQAAAIRIRRVSPLAAPVWPSIFIPVGTVIAVAPDCFVSAYGPMPEYADSAEAVLHAEDTSPAQIGTVGTPNIVAAPARSLWQMDQVGLRLILRASWAWRVPASTPAVAWMQNVTW
jgi:hypothetical protein